MIPSSPKHGDSARIAASGGPVYVVDDDPAMLRTVSGLLNTWGLDAATFSSPELLLTAVDAESRGCVVADIVMPRLGGKELQHRLSSSAPALALIAVTGYADVATAVHMMSHGAVTVLEKPYQPEELKTAIVNALEQSEHVHRKLFRVRELEVRLSTLTDEERNIAFGMIEGTLIKNVAQELNVSMRTVDRRRQTVLSKMHASSIGELAVMMSEFLHNVPAGSKPPPPRSPALFRGTHAPGMNRTKSATLDRAESDSPRPRAQ